MSRDWRWFFADMLEALRNISSHISGMTEAQFVGDRKTRAAVERELAILGEAAKQIPVEVTSKFPDVQWRNAARLRDLLNHVYFGVDPHVIWRIATEDAPRTLAQLEVVAVSEGVESLPIRPDEA